MPFRRPAETVSPRALARLRATSARGSGEPASAGSGRRSSAADSAADSDRQREFESSADRAGRHRPLEVGRGPVFELPTSLQGARWAPSRSAVLGVLAVVVVVALIFGARVWLAASDAAPVSPAAGAGPSGVSRGTSTLSRDSPGASGRSAQSAPTGGAAGSPASTGAVLVVHVVGQVGRPGVLRLPIGSRVGDAVAAAGGATRGADLAAVNLARPLVDGEQVLVPKPGQAPSGGAAGGAGPVATGGNTPGAGTTPGGGPTGLVSLNSAGLDALDSLPGVGPVLAQRILDWRAEHGRFTSVDELGEVSGIGEKVLANLRPRVTL